MWQVRLYDISAQRRPVISVNFRESPIKAVATDIDGHTVYVGTGSGDLAVFDMRIGMLGALGFKLGVVNPFSVYNVSHYAMIIFIRF